MFGGKKFLALVTARGGSKRLPRKNVLDIAGKPLIAWSIQAGLKSNYVDRVVVSTDNEEISTIAQLHGADVPFLRPEALASDFATSKDTVDHALKELGQFGEVYDFVILLQPTSPLRTESHIDGAIELLMKKKANSIVGVCEVNHPQEWTNVLPEDSSMNGFLAKDFEGKRSQDLPKRYRINGAIYIYRVSDILDEKPISYDDNCFAFIMEKECSIDIDDKFDLMIGETFLKARLNGSL